MHWLCLTDQDNRFQSKHALNKTDFKPQYVGFVAGNLSTGLSLILLILMIKYYQINFDFDKIWNFTY